MRLGALEAGGTKMVCAIGDENGNIYERKTIPTQTPEETLPRIAAFFADKGLDALGIACFGPVDPDKNSETYGYITTTPKPAWANCDIVSYMERALEIPVGFDTDVNGAALGEMTWGSTRGLLNSIYITIGTGIGVGVIANGQVLHGMLHPEGGHILLRRHPEDSYKGHCPYHGGCFEGLASGPAIEERWGAKAELLGSKQAVWDLEAYYIAQALVDYIMILSPQRIVLGGGVMKQTHLIDKIREEVRQQMAGYIRTKEMEDMDHYIVLSELAGDQGILGALKLALDEA